MFLIKLITVSIFLTTCFCRRHEQALESEELCIDEVAKDSDQSQKNDLSFLMIGAMRKSYWRCAKLIAQKQSSVDFRSVFETEHRNILKEIATLKTAIESSLPMPTVSPAFQWAQSASEILINVKFSHKIDAPATLNVEAQNVTILPDKLILRASDGRKNFNLDLNLLKDIDPNESRYEMASVGRMTVFLKKAERRKWGRLLKEDSKKIQNMHVWWAMQEKYSSELELMEGSDDNADDKKPKVKADSSATESMDSNKKDNTTTTTDDEDDDDKTGIGSGSITTPAQQERMDSVKAIDEETMKELKAVTDEAKRKKLIVDSQSREEKRRIDAEALEKKVEIEKTAEAKKRALDGNSGLLREAADKSEL